MTQLTLESPLTCPVTFSTRGHVEEFHVRASRAEYVVSEVRADMCLANGERVACSHVFRVKERGETDNSLEGMLVGVVSLTAAALAILCIKNRK